MADSSYILLPPDVLESQLAMTDLIRAMYPSLDEGMDSSLQQVIDRIRQFCESPKGSGNNATLPPNLALTVTIPIDAEDRPTASHSLPTIQINITVPLSSHEKDPTEPPPLIYSLRQPSWMSRAATMELGTGMPHNDILAAFDHVQENAPKYLEKSDAFSHQPRSPDGIECANLLRVWFYFPSLSTREKRKDLVSYASRYRLTGFVLAGKPGVLCLEGTSKDVDNYMNAIKNESWGDIPSHQKKVSERFREECGVEGRKFAEMTEITDHLGKKRGARKNRGDMAALEAFLKEKGVGESFSKVIMGT